MQGVSVCNSVQDLAYESVHSVLIEQKIKFHPSTEAQTWTFLVPNCVHALVLAIECKEGYHRDRQRIVIPGVSKMQVS